MMKKNYVIGFLSFIVCFASVGNTLLAQEENLKFSYGRVVVVSPEQVTISEYDMDAEEELDTSYTITANTRYENIASVNEIEVGDDIDIEYILNESQREAVVITKNIWIEDNE